MLVVSREIIQSDLPVVRLDQSLRSYKALHLDGSLSLPQGGDMA